MAINAAKQLLDELMGRERDLAPNEKRYTINWNDPRVCKHNLVEFCPNALFVNTKADIGPCNLVHDDYLKKEYQSKASKREKRQYEDEFIRFCQSQLSDVEKKIKRAKQRLEMSQLEKNNNSNSNSSLSEENQLKIQEINEKIEKLLEEIQQLGCEGKVDEAQAAMKEVDQLKENRALIKRENQSGHWIQQKAEIGVAQEKQMEVCDVCGAFLIVNDVQQRVDDHLMGKQHVGFGRLRTALDDLLERRRAEEKNQIDHSDREYQREDSRHRKESSLHDHHHRYGRSSTRSHQKNHRDRNRSTHRHRRRSRSRSPSLKYSHPTQYRER
ncbi:vacuolar protein-sorting protein [Sarcoptes scabiei]|uniref:Luc7-like protein 1 n=1 Tax=Sarcoptes scabiei TaxID=52283 RepID=A0A132AH98_SARSC|nr:luc7-like protein 1 [Sarcoptes scabiei]UXI15130.1 vacuolar protein-sorting protein [Sarcoptes scabiei]